MMRGGSCGLPLATTIIMAAITAFNYDRRRAAGAELNFGHYDRPMIERINDLSLMAYGVEVYKNGLNPENRLRDLHPDSGARFVANVNLSAYECHARLRERNRKMMLKRSAPSQTSDSTDSSAAAADAPTTTNEDLPGSDEPSGSIETTPVEAAAASIAAGRLSVDSTLEAMDDIELDRFMRGEPNGEPPPPPPMPQPPTELERTEPPAASAAMATAAATIPPPQTNGGAAAAGTEGGVFERLMAAQKPTANRPSKTAKSSKAAFKRTKCDCNAHCKAEFADFKRRNANKPHPGRGFKHCATCPKKQAADALLGPH